LQIVNIS